MAPSASHIMPSTEIITTNTLIVTNLDPLVFLAGNFMKIKAKFEQYGSIYKLIPIKSFNRMLVIYFQTLDAKIAKIHSDKMIFMNNVIRVYYGLHTPVYDDETDKSKHHLNIPVLEKNRLDSPPGSPKTLVDDLGYKLVNINLNNSNSNGVNVDTHNEDFSLDNNNGVNGRDGIV
ncbi:12196_t:CDS:2 [Entrophospora sp. SA101]|nr:12196_t:CDS:2 [Entrophospora sp. SA101]